jgi:hypothetical protein
LNLFIVVVGKSALEALAVGSLDLREQPDIALVCRCLEAFAVIDRS